MEGALGEVHIDQATVAPLGRIEFVMPSIRQAMEVTLQTEIQDAGIRNEWKFFAFPSAWKRTKLAQAVVAQSVSGNLRASYPTLKTVAKSFVRTANAKQLLVTDRLDEDAFALLKEGGRVLLLSLADFCPEQPGMRLGWWTASNQRGTAIVSSEAFGDFPVEEGLPSFAIFRIFHGTALIEERLANHIDPLMLTTGVGGYSSSVFQTRVGSGRLLATGLDLLSSKPEAQYLLDQFLKYVQSSYFKPKKELALHDLQAIVTSCQKR